MIPNTVNVSLKLKKTKMLELGLMIFTFFEVTTKYISSCVLKISVIPRACSTIEIADIFNTQDENF